MRNGKLRHLIVIQELDLTQNATTGDMVKEWTDCFHVWASIEPLSAREFIAAQAAQSEVSARVTIRYQAGISSEMRIKHGDVVYKIAGIMPDAKSGKEYLAIMVAQGVHDG